MKILYHHRIGSKDGQYVHIEELVGALRGQSHEVRVVGPSGFGEQPFGKQSGLVSRLKRFIPGVAYELMEFLYNAIDYLRLAGVVRRFRPDVIYERYNLYLVSGVMARRRFGIPLLLEVNAPLYDERSRFGGLSLPRLARWSECVAWRQADHVFAVTQVLAETIYEAGVAPPDVTVTANGINLGIFHSMGERIDAKRGLQLENRLVLGFVGFAREWHGLDRVIRLIAEYRGGPDLHFLFVGDGPVRAMLEKQARHAKVTDCLSVTGIVERDRIPAYVNAFDIALQPSVVAYASPLKLFEYMACGCAIVAPSMPNIREILTHEKDAWLFDPDDGDSFSDAVRRLIEDDELRCRLGTAARCTIGERNLTWTNNACIVTHAAEDLANRTRQKKREFREKS